MANMNKNFPGQGKTQKQYEDSSRFAWYSIIAMIILLILMMFLTGCTGVYYLTDAEYSDAREEHASITYYNNLVYWGWSDGYYYYYGTPHYYPWYYYYNTCPPSHHTPTTHIVVHSHVDRPTHRPNRPTHRPNTIIKTNTNVKSNVNRNNKVIIKTNNGSKRTNKTTIRRKPKK